MSDMEAIADFTVRDLNRHLAKVLEACNRVGSVRIKHRNGQAYQLTPAPPEPDEVKPAYPDFAARRKALGMKMMTRAQRDKLDALIRGD